jgi:DNA-binding MarR family transcriptional regulator
LGPERFRRPLRNWNRTVRTRTAIDTPRLRLVLMRIARRLRQATTAGITPSQLSALATLDRSGPMSLRDLAAAEKVGPSTLTRVVAALEEQDLIERGADPTDRRVALVSVTPHGRTWVAQARDRASQLLGKRVAALDPEDAATLAAAIPVLEALLGDER